jgi:hypothetical protein
METIASNNYGVHFAGGSFQLGGNPFNIVRSDPVTGQITPISPPQVSGINNEEQAGIYNIYSISVDDASNIYVSGNFGVTAQGQYQAASILKIDQNGNFVTIIAPETNTPSTLGAISGTNAVTINRINQWVFVVDSNNTSGNAVKAFAFNGAPPGGGGTTSPCGPPTSVNVNTDNGTVSVVSPDDGSMTTISNQSQASFDQNQPPTAVLQILPDGIINDTSVRIGTSLVDADTGSTVTTSWVVNPDGSTSITMTVRASDGTSTVRSGTGTPTANPDGSTTSTINLLGPDGTTLINSVTVASNPAGGKTITTTKVIAVLGGGTYTTVTTISSDSSGNINISLTLPDIITGNSYVTTVSTNNGATTCNLTSIPWTAGQTDPTITLAQDFCSSSPFNISINPTAEGALGTDCATITTTTNNPTGFKTTLSASSENLACTTDSGTYNLAPAADPDNQTALSNNQWGWYLGYSTPDTFFAPPTTPYVIQSGDIATAGNSSIFWIGAQLDLSQPPCTYTGEIVITASVNPLPAPTIASISPASGSTDGGNVITITGSNFGTADNPYISGINVGGSQCTFTSVVDNNTATCVTPAHTAGTYDVSVVGYGGSATLPGSFTFITPQATACLASDATSANIQIDKDTNMLPVTFTGTSTSPSWAIASNANWCSYSSKQWANAVTVKNPSTYVNAPAGTNIPESDILGYWVYIPRYAYEVERYYAFNAPVAANNFSINFEKASTTKKVPAAPSSSTTTNTACYATPTSAGFTAYDYRTGCGISRTYGAATGTTWGTHPAFTFNGKELNGFWIGKFETSGTRAAPQIKPNQNTNIGEYPGVYYDMGKAMGVLDTNATGGNSTTVTQNSHSLAAAKTHMALNSDWGAATYLAASQYGAGYNNIQLNAAFGAPSSSTDADGNGGSYITNDMAGITGCGPSSSGNTGTYAGGTTLNTSTLQSLTACANDTTHPYQGTIGVLASTTNNVYGVYDMAGGAYDMVMANYNNTATNFTTMPFAAYANIYPASPFNTRPTWSASSNATYYGFDVCNWTLCGGQANYEVNTVQSVTADFGWLGDYSRMPSSNGYVWTIRGGRADNGANAGIFAQSDGNGASQAYIGFRAVLGAY